MKPVCWVLIGVLGPSLSPFAGSSPSQGVEGAKQQIRSVFAELDKNKDGKLSMAEYGVIWKGRPEAGKNFKAYDKNKDGFISLEEFLAPVQRVEDARKSKKPSK